MKNFIAKNRIRIENTFTDNNPNMTDSANMNHFKSTLRMGKRQMTIIFSQGYGIQGEPTAASVLDCLASDAAGVENARSFEDWCGDYGYDTDSRKAENIFKACEKQAEKLKNFLGDDLYKACLYDTERL